ncbi:hypothetical protein GCM10027089_38110 [Nocardia thraciensis]
MACIAGFSFAHSLLLLGVTSPSRELNDTRSNVKYFHYYFNADGTSYVGASKHGGLAQDPVVGGTIPINYVRHDPHDSALYSAVWRCTRNHG